MFSFVFGSKTRITSSTLLPGLEYVCSCNPFSYSIKFVWSYFPIPKSTFFSTSLSFLTIPFVFNSSIDKPNCFSI